MPQITLEHTRNAVLHRSAAELLGDVHATVARLAAAEIGNCKSRLLVRDEVRIARGDPGAGFVHLECALLAGRSAETKAALGAALLDLLGEAFGAAAGARPPELTVEVRDMDPGGYFKRA